MSEVTACAECGRLHAYRVPICIGCGGGQFTLCSPPFAAEIYSHTRIARAPTPALQAETPYTAVLVRGPQGGLLLLRWRGTEQPAIGDLIRVCDSGGTLVAQHPAPEL